jgi:hypothetical protein
LDVLKQTKQTTTTTLHMNVKTKDLQLKNRSGFGGGNTFLFRRTFASYDECLENLKQQPKKNHYWTTQTNQVAPKGSLDCK